MMLLLLLTWVLIVMLPEVSGHRFVVYLSGRCKTSAGPATHHRQLAEAGQLAFRCKVVCFVLG